MKSDAEIRAKLDYYKGILAGFTAGSNVDSPDVFLAVEQAFPGRALAALSLTNELAEMVKHLPSEDQKGISEAFADYARQFQRFLESRITILKWVLDEGGEGV